MADLASAFQHIALETTSTRRYHTVNITYPAMRLLPKGTSLHLRRPQNVEYREKPELGTYHLNQDTLGFFHRFEVKDSGKDGSEPQGSAGLITAFNAISRFQGKSQLEVVSYTASDGHETQYIFHLTTESRQQNDGNSTNPPNQTHRTFYLTSSNLTANHFLNKHKPTTTTPSWLALLTNLLDRTSDRAFLHVQHQLLTSQNPTLALLEIALTSNKWATTPPPSARALLLSNLTIRLPGNAAPIPLAQIDEANLSAHAHREIDVCLPCGHEELLCYASLRDLSETACLSAACAACGAPILSERERALAMLKTQREMREAWSWTEVYAADLDGAVEGFGAHEAVRVEARRVSEALGEQLEVFEVPGSVTPRALSVARFDETRAVALALNEWLLHGCEGGVLVVSPVELVGTLQSKSLLALAEFAGWGNLGLPEEFYGFLGRWITRTVNSVVGSQRERVSAAVDDVSMILARVCVE